MLVGRSPIHVREARAQVDDSSNEGPGETSPYLCSCLIYLRAGPPQNLWLLRRPVRPPPYQFKMVSIRTKGQRAFVFRGWPPEGSLLNYYGQVGHHPGADRGHAGSGSLQPGPLW